MTDRESGRIKYSILDPTGNITALVESYVEMERQPETAAFLMQLHPEVEQVGFVDFDLSRGENGQEDGVYAKLRMAGGEFCGNASMCAAALFLIRKAELQQADQKGASCSTGSSGRTGSTCPGSTAGGCNAESSCKSAVRLRVSGAADPVELSLEEDGSGGFSASIRMPPALEIYEKEFAAALPAGGLGEGADKEILEGSLPVVRMEGISHIVIEKGSPFYALLLQPEAAKEAVCRWCEELQAEGLGLMFLEESAQPAQGTGALPGNRSEEIDAHACPALIRARMTPLVYVPSINTVFWEHSCASGSTAAGAFLEKRAGGSIEAALLEPGGILCVKSRASEADALSAPGDRGRSSGIILSGHVRLAGSYEAILPN